MNFPWPGVSRTDGQEKEKAPKWGLFCEIEQGAWLGGFAEAYQCVWIKSGEPDVFASDTHNPTL
jgi:hypothetical protein